MTHRQVRKAFSLRQLLLILTAGVLLYVGLDFFQQASVSQQRRADLRQVELEIATAQEEKAQLEKRLDYVRSPGAAEEWARENGWARPDEVLVVVVAPPAERGHGTEGNLEDLQPDSSRDAWWDLFFGTH